MPVIDTIQVTWTFGTMKIDTLDPSTPIGTLVFKRYENDVYVRTEEFIATGMEELGALMAGTPTPGLNRGDDLVYACYNYAIQRGWIAGTVH